MSSDDRGISDYNIRIQDLLYCNSSQYILSTYNSQHNNNNNNVVLAMTMPYRLVAKSLLTQHYYINREPARTDNSVWEIAKRSSFDLPDYIKMSIWVND